MLRTCRQQKRLGAFQRKSTIDRFWIDVSGLLSLSYDGLPVRRFFAGRTGSPSYSLISRIERYRRGCLETKMDELQSIISRVKAIELSTISFGFTKLPVNEANSGRASCCVASIAR